MNVICYAGEMQKEIKIADAKALRGGMMLLTFSTGKKHLFDMTMLKGAAFAPLTDETVFGNHVIFNGMITWNDGKIDIAPETVC